MNRSARMPCANLPSMNSKVRSALAASAFASIREMIAGRVNLIEDFQTLRIDPGSPGSFAIEVRDEVKELAVFAGAWHSHLEDPNDVCNCVMWLLTPFYRIVQVERRESPVTARLERFEPPGQWELVEETGTFAGWYGRRRNLVTTTLQQRVLEAPPEFLAQFGPGVVGDNGFPTLT